MGRIYAIANQKGGVGKTTTAVNLGSGFARLGQKVLVVDMDQQCNATVALGGDKSMRPSSYEVLEGDFTLSEAAQPGGDCHGQHQHPLRPNTRLREKLGTVKDDFDFILIDCPPALGPVTVNALAAADRVIVPVQAEYLALEGLVQFLDTLSTVRREINPNLELAGVVVTMDDERTRLAQDVERDLRDHFSETVFRNVIPRTVRVAEAPSYGIPVTEYAPSSRGSTAYLALADEVINRG